MSTNGLMKVSGGMGGGEEGNGGARGESKEENEAATAKPESKKKAAAGTPLPGPSAPGATATAARDEAEDEDDEEEAPCTQLMCQRYALILIEEMDERCRGQEEGAVEQFLCDVLQDCAGNAAAEQPSRSLFWRCKGRLMLICGPRWRRRWNRCFTTR